MAARFAPKQFLRACDLSDGEFLQPPMMGILRVQNPNNISSLLDKLLVCQKSPCANGESLHVL